MSEAKSELSPGEAFESKSLRSEAELGRFIPEHYHYQMLLDEARMRGVWEALATVVPQSKNKRVLELGCGTGVLSFYAAQAGAEQVWCVERQPGLADRARELLEQNGVANRVSVVTGDAFTYLPPEPVDVVVCEMLHSALLRESQVAMIAAFRQRYAERFGPQLPIFVPQASLLGVEPVACDFDFFGYRAALPLFEDPGNLLSERIRPLGPVVPYRIVDYNNALVEPLAWQGALEIDAAGECTGLRFITRNVLALRPDQSGVVEWMNQNLVIPLPAPQTVAPGQSLQAGFAYSPGDEIEALAQSLRIA